MSDISLFFDMGGYAGYVWPSFGIAALGLLCLTFSSLRSLRKAQKTLMELQKSAFTPGNET